MEKMSVNGKKRYTDATGLILDHWQSSCFMKIDTEDDMSRGSDILFQYFETRTENVLRLRRRWFGPCSNL